MSMRIVTLTSAVALMAALAGAANAADLVIGSAGPLTNSEALFGNTWMNGMELAIRQTNEAGGTGGLHPRFHPGRWAGECRRRHRVVPGASLRLVARAPRVRQGLQGRLQGGSRSLFGLRLHGGPGHHQRH